MLRLLAFVLPLGLDSFVVAAVLGAAARLTGRDRLRISAIFVVFEGGMPLLGLALAAPLARAVSGIADYMAAAALAGLGTWMLLSRGSGDDEDRAARLAAARGITILGLGVSISLDELAIGFTLGLARPSVSGVIAAIVIQAFLAAQLGLLLGARTGERLRENAERLAAIAFIALGGCLLIEHLLHR
ncbi:MAG TPA: manganese efflux pump [Streptosporangiaceae bacterium]|nr:manganese efflux pump [Streptosporangiaceae bacterium]